MGLGDVGLVMAAAAASWPGSGGRKKGSGTASMGGATGLPRRSPGSSVNGEPWKKAALLCEDKIDVRAPVRAVPGMPAEVADRPKTRNLTASSMALLGRNVARQPQMTHLA